MAICLDFPWYFHGFYGFYGVPGLSGHGCCMASRCDVSHGLHGFDGLVGHSGEIAWKAWISWPLWRSKEVMELHGYAWTPWICGGVFDRIAMLVQIVHAVSMMLHA